MNRKTLQLKGVNFCAALVIDDGRVVEAAPILKHYMGQTERRVRELCGRKHVGIIEVKDLA